MSLSIEELIEANKKYKEMAEKAKKILGFNPIDTDHYGMMYMYGVQVDLETKESELIKIHNDCCKWFESIITLFENNDLQFKDEYLVNCHFTGALMLLNTYVNIYESNDAFKKVLCDFSKMTKRIKLMEEQHGLIEDRYFSIPYQNFDNSEIYYYLYGTIVSLNTSDYDLECIIKQYHCINNKVNSNLQLCGYNDRNIIYCNHQNYEFGQYNRSYFIFGQYVNKDTQSNELIKIINTAIEFEKKFKTVINELNINDKYSIEYSNQIWIFFGGCGYSFYINMNYEIIKKKLMDIFKIKSE